MSKPLKSVFSGRDLDKFFKISLFLPHPITVWPMNENCAASALPNPLVTPVITIVELMNLFL